MSSCFSALSQWAVIGVLFSVGVLYALETERMLAAGRKGHSVACFLVFVAATCGAVWLSWY